MEVAQVEWNSIDRILQTGVRKDDNKPEAEKK